MNDEISQARARKVKDEIIDVEESHAQQRLKQLNGEDDAKADRQGVSKLAHGFEHAGQEATQREKHDQVADNIFNDRTRIDPICGELFDITPNRFEGDKIGLAEIKADRILCVDAAVEQKKFDERQTVYAEKYLQCNFDRFFHFVPYTEWIVPTNKNSITRKALIVKGKLKKRIDKSKESWYYII